MKRENGLPEWVNYITKNLHNVDKVEPEIIQSLLIHIRIVTSLDVFLSICLYCFAVEFGGKDIFKLTVCFSYWFHRVKQV